jgi:hypothetical protein
VILKHVKRATFLCPTALTGGPEAIHQAARAFTDAGLPSDIAYYGNGGRIAVRDGRLECTAPDFNPCPEAYAGYGAVTCTTALLRPHHLLVLPEVLVGSAHAFGRARVAIWWLSVDNAAEAAGEPAVRAALADRSLLHLHQSAYAEDFLRRGGVTTSLLLGDHTTAEFTEHSPAGPGEERSVAYNPAKGADISSAFFADQPHLVQVPIRGMSRSETAEVLRRTLLYVDFGHLPGKDRLPREAAASGCVVFVRARGAGLFPDDFPVPDFFRFTEDDVASGELGRRIAAVQADPAVFWTLQASFRERTRREQQELRDQVRDLRGLARVA